MDNIRAYREEDYETICQWLKARGQGIIPADYLPSYGYIIDNVACGFLYRTDSKMGLIENYITNPLASKKARYIALMNITKAIVNLAENLEIKYLTANTSLRSIGKMAEKNEFQLIGQQFTFLRGL